MVLQAQRTSKGGQRDLAAPCAPSREQAWKRGLRAAFGALASLELTLAALSSLLLLVVLCTLGQVTMGLYASVETYIHGWFVWAPLPIAGWRAPILPGGALAGAVLLVNLACAQLARLEWSRRKGGLWLCHLGLALLFAGEFATALVRTEGRMVLHEGETSRVVEVEHPAGRIALPFALTLEKFTHETYRGTDVPRSFSSLVRLSDPARREDRDALISMNRPLRYEGRAIYQAGFDEGGVSILEVVENPSRLVPYFACALVALGLAWHFLARLAGGRSA